MKRFLILLALIALLAFPVMAQETAWKQAPTELSVDGFFQQDATSHNWQGVITGAMLAQVSAKALLGGTGAVLWQKGMDGYAVGPTVKFIYPIGLRDWDLTFGGDANALAGDLADAATWQAVTRIGMRRHLGTQGSSVEPGVHFKRAFGGPQTQALDQVGFYLTVSLGINPPASP